MKYRHFHAHFFEHQAVLPSTSYDKVIFVLCNTACNASDLYVCFVLIFLFWFPRCPTLWPRGPIFLFWVSSHQQDIQFLYYFARLCLIVCVLHRATKAIYLKLRAVGEQYSRLVHKSLNPYDI